MIVEPSTADIPARLGIPNTLPPLCRRDLRRLSGFGIIGALILLYGLFPSLYIPKEMVWLWIGSWILVAVVTIICTIRHKWIGKGKTPRVGQSAQKTAFTAVMLSFGIGFFFWGKSIGLPFQTIVAVLLMVEGIGGIFVSLTDWWRLSHAGLSAGLIAAGFLLPLVELPSMGVPIGISVIAGTAGSAALLHWQVRYHESSFHSK